MSETPVLDVPPADSIEDQVAKETIHSVYESPGTISNANDFETSPLLIPGGQGSANVIVDEGGKLIISPSDWFKQEVDDKRTQQIKALLTPLARLTEADLRARGETGTLRFDITVSDEVAKNDEAVAAELELPEYPLTVSKSMPHTDPGEPFYIGTIGATTQFWESDFQIPVGASKEARKKAFFDHITHKNLAPRRPASGEMTRVDPDVTVHASPNNDPAIQGERRIFFYVAPSNAATPEQTVA